MSALSPKRWEVLVPAPTLLAYLVSRPALGGGS
jgi:hypothetical protein